MNKISNKSGLVCLFLIACFAFLSQGCDPTAKNILGKWKLTTMGDTPASGNFTIEFREDGTYTAESGLQGFPGEPFSSNPFRSPGTYSGYFEFPKDKVMNIREEYRGPVRCFVSRAEGNELKIKYDTYGEHEIELIFERIN